PRRFRRARRGLGCRAARRRGGPLDLVAQALAGGKERERGHEPGADRHGRGRDVLRLPGRGGAPAGDRGRHGMSGFYVAASVVTLVHWLRMKDRRLLPLLGLFSMMAAAHAFEWWHQWHDDFELAAIVCGLALLPLTDRRGTPAAAPRS